MALSPRRSSGPSLYGQLLRIARILGVTASASDHSVAERTGKRFRHAHRALAALYCTLPTYLGR
jgi:hypothetical protein